MPCSFCCEPFREAMRTGNNVDDNPVVSDLILAAHLAMCNGCAKWILDEHIPSLPPDGVVRGSGISFSRDNLARMVVSARLQLDPRDQALGAIVAMIFLRPEKKR